MQGAVPSGRAGQLVRPQQRVLSSSRSFWHSCGAAAWGRAEGRSSKELVVRQPRRCRSAKAPMARASRATAGGAAFSATIGKRAVIVGAGPAGALTAILLAKQGYKVDVFERLAPMVNSEGEVLASIGPRSYNILLSERAVTALEQAGADLSNFDVPDLKYSLRHKLKGGPTDGIATLPPGRLKVANRGVLAGALVQACLAQHADSVQFHFEQELNVIDINNGAAYFRPVGSAAEGAAMASGSVGSGGGCGCSATGACADGSEGSGSEQAAGGSGSGGTTSTLAPPEVLTQERTPSSPESLVCYAFDVLVGADGASSLVRQVMQRHDKAIQVQQQRDVMEFKTCQMGPADRYLPPGCGKVGTFQTWSNSKLKATLIGSSTQDGELRAVFILPEGEHAKLKTAADYESYLAAVFPSLPADTVKSIAPQLAECPVSNGGTLTRCSKLNSRRVVLVGDAAHSVYPSLGQGANAALEGAATLAAVLQELGQQDMDAAAAEYSRRWLPNAHAVVDLTAEAFGGNSRAFAPNLKLVQLISQALLHKVLPFLIPQPAFLQINSTTVPYHVLLERSRREFTVFKALLFAAAAAALAALWRACARPAMAALGLA